MGARWTPRVCSWLWTNRRSGGSAESESATGSACSNGGRPPCGRSWRGSGRRSLSTTGSSPTCATECRRGPSSRRAPRGDDDDPRVGSDPKGNRTVAAPGEAPPRRPPDVDDERHRLDDELVKVEQQLTYYD